MEVAFDQRNFYQEQHSWYAVYTIVRHEKAVNKALTQKKITTFLPIKKVVNRWKDRKKEVSMPLFPGYLFVNLLEEDRLNILNTQGVIRILGTNGEPEPIPEKQIEFIKTLVETNLNYDPWPYYTEGKEVIVVRGPLDGMCGKIVERRGEFKHTRILWPCHSHRFSLRHRE